MFSSRAAIKRFVEASGIPGIPLAKDDASVASRIMTDGLVSEGLVSAAVLAGEIGTVVGVVEVVVVDDD